MSLLSESGVFVLSLPENDWLPGICTLRAVPTGRLVVREVWARWMVDFLVCWSDPLRRFRILKRSLQCWRKLADIQGQQRLSLVPRPCGAWERGQ